MNWPLISELVRETATGKRSAESTVRDSLARATETEEFHSLLETNSAALDRAREIDARIAAGDKSGALLGVPFTVKDNFLTCDTTTTAASKMLETFTSPYQATAVELLEAEGAILVAKANMDEFGHGSSTENSAFGPTKNPHDPKRVPGGSSGGSAAAVALGIAPFSLGTDTGGSVRLPASYCGVVGYKPTYGLVSRFGVIAMASSMDVVGPITTNVRDSALVLNVLAGTDSQDSTTIEREESYLFSNPSDIKGLRVGLITSPTEGGVASEVASRISGVAEKLIAQGATVSEVDLPLNELALAVYYIIVPAEISSNLARYDGVKYGISLDNKGSLLETYRKSRGQGFGPEVIRRVLTGTYVLSSGYQDAFYKKAQKVRTLITEEYARAFDKFDVLIGPTAPTTAFGFGEKRDPLSMYLSDSLTIAANLAGIPAVSIPTSGAEGMPVGLQLLAAQRQDRRLLEISAAVEDIL